MSIDRTFSGGYVDVDRGVVSREIFTDADIYQLELDRIFSKGWLFIGFESQLAKPGDYFVSRMGEESVIMVKDRDGEIHVMLNSCRHRGMKVCRYDEGNTPVFTCPYHGWSYGLNGSLLGVPRFADSYHSELDKTAWGLLEARVANYRGTIWAMWDSEGPEFLEYLGDMVQVSLDPLLDAIDGGDGEYEVLPGVQKWIVPCNWKFTAENAIGDLYHTPTHTSVEIVGIGPGGIGQTRHGINFGKRRLTVFPESGHGTRGSPLSVEDDAKAPDLYPFPAFRDPDLEAYYQQSWERWRENRAGEWPLWTVHSGGNILSAMSYHTRFPRTVMAIHPAGPTSTEMWRWYLVDKNMPKEVKEAYRHYLLRYSGPGGLTEGDDMENWSYATEASKGTVASRLPYNMQMGWGHHEDTNVPYRGARFSESAVTEVSALAYYAAWAKRMDDPRPASITGTEPVAASES